MASKDISIKLGNGTSNKLPIQPFRPEMFVADPSIVMIAKRGSGKSWVVRSLLEYFKDIPMGLIIAPTDRMNCFYGNFFPDTYIHYSYKSEIIERVLARQRKIIDKEKIKKAQGKKLDTRAFVVMDDCLGQKGAWVRDQPIQELLYNGRHYRIMYILTMQFPLGITPELRSNFDYIFLLAEDYISNMKRIYDHYAGMFPTFDSFRQIHGQLTQDFGAMVIVNRGVRNSLFEKIFYYKAEDLSDIKVDMGCKQFREFHKRNYNKNWRDKQNEFNVDEYLMNKKKNKSVIAVEKVKTNNNYNSVNNTNNNSNHNNDKNNIYNNSTYNYSTIDNTPKRNFGKNGNY